LAQNGVGSRLNEFQNVNKINYIETLDH
jgi:hypothetical protein